MMAVGRRRVGRRREARQAPVEGGDHRLALRFLADGCRNRAHGGAHAVEIRRQRHDHDVALQPAQQVDGGRDAEGAGEHEVGIVAQHVLGRAMRDGDALGLRRNRRHRRIGRQMRHRRDPLAPHQLDQELVGAQVERDDAGWFGEAFRIRAGRTLRKRRHGRKRQG